MRPFPVGLFLILVLTVPAWADTTPMRINYQGRLTDNTPQQDPITATVPMEFKVYGSQMGTDLEWSEIWPAVDVVDGIFSVLLGSQGSPLSPDVFAGNSEHYLEIVIMGEVLAPRQRLASVPFSHVADMVDSFEGAELEESVEIDTKIAVHHEDPKAHDSLLQNYTTHAEIDSIVLWPDWEIENIEPGDELRFTHPSGGEMPVMTLQSPAGGGNVGIGTSTPGEKLEVDGAVKIGNTTGSTPGTLRYTGTEMQANVQGTWKSLVSADSPTSVRDFGALGDGVTDDFEAVQAAIDSLADTGGVVFFPTGEYYISQQIVLPNDGAAMNVRQKPIKLQGAGALMDGRGGLPNGGSIVDLRYRNGPKIATYGLGLLETEGITFADRTHTSSTAPFIYTTNTTLHIHDCSFSGPTAGGDATNDAIVLGGTSGDVDGTGGPDPNAPFQGYGTVIRDNYFSRIRRMVYGRVFANAVMVTGNTVWRTCSTNLPDGAAIELDGDPDDVTPQVNAGWYVAGNLIEMRDYVYGIKTSNSQRNVFFGNHFFDPGSRTLHCYRFEETGRLNYVAAGFYDHEAGFVDDQATGNWRSTVIDSYQNEESRFAQKLRFMNSVYIEPDSDSPYGPRLLNRDGDELTYQFGFDDSLLLTRTPAGGSPVPMWQVKDRGNGIISQELKGTDARITNSNGRVRVQSKVGSPLELGDTNGLGVKIDNGAVELTSTAVQILSGNGAPVMSAPDGSIYLRADGEAGHTLYVRESNAWVSK